jgi:hypothetical protein
MLKNLDSLNGAEKIIIDDFLDYIDRNFKFLNPYDNISLCKNDKSLLIRRIKNLLESIVKNKNDIKYQRSWAYYIETNLKELRMIGLVVNYPEEPKEWKLDLSLYYGDTMNQARSFYSNDIDFSLINQLVLKGWQYIPNFHISHIQTHLLWFETPEASKERYFKIWKHQFANKIKQYEKEELLKLLEELKQENLIILDDNTRNNLKKEVEDTNRKYFNICPGFGLIYSYPSTLATELDMKNEMSAEMKLPAAETAGYHQVKIII